MRARHAHAHRKHLLHVAEGDLGLVARVGRGPQEHGVDHANAELEARQSHREAGGAARSLNAKKITLKLEAYTYSKDSARR